MFPYLLSRRYSVFFLKFLEVQEITESLLETDFMLNICIVTEIIYLFIGLISLTKGLLHCSEVATSVCGGILHKTLTRIMSMSLQVAAPPHWT